jgi:nicotinamidase-related amidase
MVDLEVASAEEAAARFREAGGTIETPPFDIQIGRAAVVRDPWGNRLVLLDFSKGMLLTDAGGRILGNAPPPPPPRRALPAGATPGNTALLVVDVMNACAHERHEDPGRGIRFSRIRAMVPRLAAFVEAFRGLGGAVLLVKSVPWQERFLPDNLNELYREDAGARYWSADRSGHAEQLYGLPEEGAEVFTKCSYDAFTCAELVAALERRRIRYVIVAGVFGDGCVLATICGGFARGYRLVMAADLIETTDDPGRQAVQAHLKARTWPQMYGATLDGAEILRGLVRDPLTPA